jgi:CDP-glycerol glycerophosphotransferase (TagB/SpsB family)
MRSARTATKTRIVVFGTGQCATSVLAALRRGVEVAAASDNSAARWGQHLGEVPIIPPARIPTVGYDYVVVCSTWAAQIVPPLVASGIPRECIVSCYAIDDRQAHRRQEIATLNTLFDLSAVNVPGLSRHLIAPRKPRRDAAAWLAACRRVLSSWRDGRAWYRLFQRLPINRKIAFFDSYWGQGYSCNPRAISEYLATRHDGHRWTIVWGFTTPSSIATPRSVIKVKRLGIAYHYYAARAGVLISNVNFPDHIEKQRGSIHVQTMHGTPIKTLGLDIPGEFRTLQDRTAFLDRCARWDYLTAPGQYTAGIARRAFQFDKTILPFGYPRNDYLFSGNNSDEIARLRRALGIPDTQKVLLFAPTWRPTGDDGVLDTTRAVLNAFATDTELRDEYVLLVRFHHLMRRMAWSSLDAKRANVIDVSDHADNRELMLAADALITDYSSIVFDYALLERPIVLCCLDYQRYANETRGVYIDIVQESPWPVYQTAADVTGRLRHDVRQLTDLTAHRRFVASYGEWERGDACKRIYESVIVPWLSASRPSSATESAAIAP